MRILTLTFLLACGGSKDDAGETTATGPTWPTTCDTIDVDGRCLEWGGEQTTDHDTFADLCDSQGGEYSDAVCPSDAIAACETDQGAGLLADYLYYAPDYDLATAQAHCEGLASCQFSCVFVEL